MKFTTPFVVAALAAAFLISNPGPVQGQKQDPVLTLQRDIYDVKRALEDMKGGQDEKIVAMQALLTQMNQTLTAELQKLAEKSAADRVEQQKMFGAPLSDVKREVQDVSTSMLGVQTNVDSLTRQQSDLASKVETIRLTMTSILNKVEEVAAKPVVTEAPPPNAEQEAQLAFAAAYSKMALHTEEATLEAYNALLELSQKYPTSPYAPLAMFEVAGMYASRGQYDQAVTAYDQILEQFGQNAMRPQAQFRKAEALEKLDRKADAIREYEAFAKAHPGDANASIAIGRAKDLKAPPARGKGKGK